MAPMDPSITSRTVAVNGMDLHVLEAGEGPLVLLAHGFPELAYSWRHQLPALAAAGYRVVAPDQRGYGQSTRPEAIDDYNVVNLTNDLLGLMDLYGEEQAVVVGHDWGSMVAWTLAQLAPERLRGVVGMSVPFSPRGDVAPTVLMRQIFADVFFYILYFQEPGVADADLAADPATTMRRMLGALRSEDGGSGSMFSENDGRGFVERLPETDQLPDWLTEEELAHYVAEFTRTGFTGGINWYRNFDRNWELTAHLTEGRITIPSAFIGGTLDPVLTMSPPENMLPLLDDHRGSTLIDGAGHWVQQDSPEQTNAALLAFLASLDT